MPLMPLINREKCNGCGLCVSVCHCGAFVMIDGTVTIIETKLCGWCTNCEAVCPTGAIECAFEILFADR